jgi:hypothetical protein
MGALFFARAFLIAGIQEGLSPDRQGSPIADHREGEHHKTSVFLPLFCF